MKRVVALGMLCVVALTATGQADSRKAGAGEKQIVIRDAQFAGRRAADYFRDLINGYAVYDERLDLVELLGDPVPGERKEFSVFYACEPGGGLKAYLTKEDETPEANGRRMTHVLLSCE